MKISFLTKCRDACWAIRVMVPMPHLLSLGHEVKEELLELKAACPNCRGNYIEYQYTDANPFKCPTCGLVFHDGQSWKTQVIDLIDWADLIVFQRPTDLAHLRLMKFAKEQGKKVVVEGDDDYINVPEWNPGKKYYEDRRGVVEEMFRIADGVTVTTESLKTVYSKYNEKIKVCPNTIDIEIMDAEPRIPELPVYNKRGKRIPYEHFLDAKKKFKIMGWGGSPTHERDLEVIVTSLRRVCRKEPVALAFVGYVHRALIEVIPDDQLFLFSLVPVSAYFSLYKTIKFDIGLAPVAEVKFNEGKSPNKLMEYHALGALGVASDFVTYKDYIHRGFLASPNDEIGWTSALRKAVSCDDFSDRLAENRRYVEENFDIKKNIHHWDNFYREVLGQ